MSNNGLLTVSVMNTDSFPSNFYLEVVNCSAGIMDILAMNVYIPGFGFVTEKF